MSKERFVHIPEVRGQEVKRVIVEREKEYGIFLPQWNDVVHAVKTFASGDFQKVPPLAYSEVTEERRKRRNEPASDEYAHIDSDELKHYSFIYQQFSTEENIIDKNLEFAKRYFDGKFMHGQLTEMNAWKIDSEIEVARLPGQAFYGMSLTLEGLRRPSDFTSKQAEPYLLSIHSKYFHENPESKLAEALGAERATLPRRVCVEWNGRGGEAKVDCDSVVKGLNNQLGTNDNGELLSADELSTNLYVNSRVNHSMGIYSGLELKLLPYNVTVSTLRNETILRYPLDDDQPYGPISWQIKIADPELESRAAPASAIIPPEKRQAAQALMEKVKNSFLK